MEEAVTHIHAKKPVKADLVHVEDVGNDRFQVYRSALEQGDRFRIDVRVAEDRFSSEFSHLRRNTIASKLGLERNERADVSCLTCIAVTSSGTGWLGHPTKTAAPPGAINSDMPASNGGGKPEEHVCITERVYV